MTDVRTFKIKGEIRKGQTRIPFAVEMNAVKEADALERVYTEMGGRHGARRFEIKISKVEEIKSDTAELKA